jgi:hypothetical protein
MIGGKHCGDSSVAYDEAGSTWAYRVVSLNRHFFIWETANFLCNFLTS